MTRFDDPKQARRGFSAGLKKLVTSIMLATACLGATATMAAAETRSLKLYFIHTREKAEIVYKRNGRFDQKGLNEINRFLRDWRRNEPTKMDTRLLDTVWEIYRAAGARDYIHVVSAYRSPATNSMLRSRSKGVANSSQHMLGKAMDFYIPGVKLATLRNLGLKMGAGGVGYYPSSGSPFIHVDVGNVRHWPRMSRSQLLAVFPKGDTMHVPSDGKPLPGYQQALASYQSRQKNGGSVQIASASSSTRRSGGFLSALFGGGADDEEDSNVDRIAQVRPEHSRAMPRRTAAQQPAAQPAPVEAPQAAPEPEMPAETIVAALPARNAPLPGSAPRARPADAGAAMMAALAPMERQSSADARRVVEEAILNGASSKAAAMPVLDAPFKEESDIAFNAPLPTKRPQYTPEAVALPDSANVLLAAVESAPRPGSPSIEAAITDASGPSVAAAAMQENALTGEDDGSGLAAAYAAIPTARPDFTMNSGLAALAAANVSDIVPVPQTAPLVAQAPVVAQNEVILAATGEGGADAAPSQRVAMLNPNNRNAPAVSAPQPIVKTTSKGSKPRSGDAKSESKAVIVAAEPESARWALHKDYVIKNTKGTKAPSFAYNVVRTAPREVYTSGFQKADQTADANRFTGKAVEFLSVARFN